MSSIPQTPITPHQCKKLIRAFLEENKLPFTRLTARTIDFTDLARCSRVFVKIHGWHGSPLWDDMLKIARANTFCLEMSAQD